MLVRTQGQGDSRSYVEDDKAASELQICRIRDMISRTGEPTRRGSERRFAESRCADRCTNLYQILA